MKAARYPRYSLEQRSIMQLEYHAALKLGIDVLVFMLNEDAPLPRKFDDLDKDPEIRRWREELKERWTVSFFDHDSASIEIGPALTNWLANKYKSFKFGPFAPELQEVLESAKALARKDSREGTVTIDHVFRVLSSKPEAGAKFVCRKEYFGSLIYDTTWEDYIPFDRDATEIFKLAEGTPLDQVFESVKDRIQRTAFDTFVQLCQSINLLDTTGKFTGVFIGQDWSKEGHLSAPTRVYLSCRVST